MIHLTGFSCDFEEKMWKISQLKTEELHNLKFFKIFLTKIRNLYILCKASGAIEGDSGEGSVRLQQAFLF